MPNNKKEPSFQDLVTLLYQHELNAEKRREETEKLAEKRREETEKAAEKRREETEKELKQYRIVAEKRQEELDKKLNRMIETYQKAGLIAGKTAEESVYRSVGKLFSKRGKIFNKVEKNVSLFKNGKRFAEYDIVAVNGNEVMPIEVKNNLTTDDIDHFVSVQIPKFKEGFGEYKDYKLIGGVGGMLVSESVENYAKKKGLYVFLQNGENIALANDENFKEKAF
jgi:hypothetical protein